MAWSASPRRRTSPRTCLPRGERRRSAGSSSAQGFWLQPSAYGAPYPVTRAADRGGRRAPRCCARRSAIRCPVHLLHGQRDPDVPWQTALRLAERLESDDVTVELIKAGDHRLSPGRDLAQSSTRSARAALGLERGIPLSARS